MHEQPNRDVRSSNTGSDEKAGEPHSVVIESRRLALRHQRLDDAPFLLALMNDPDWLHYIGDRGVRTVEDSRLKIVEAIDAYERSGFGLYLVETKEEGEPVGICGLVERDFLPIPDIGFALAPEHRGRGYAREAATVTLQFAHRELGLERLAAIVSPDNAASIRLLEALGFRFDREHEAPGGDPLLVYSVELG